MATLTLPKISQFNTGSVALGTDVLANDQYIKSWLEGANIDSTNVSLSMTPIWTGTHTFNNTVLGSILAANGDGVYNLGITSSSGVNTITAANGNTISSVSPSTFGYIYMPSVTAGRNVLLKVTCSTSQYVIRDRGAGASSDFTNLEFGITAAADWAQDLPIFIYAVNRNDTDFTGADGNSTFGWSINPAFVKTPSTAARLGDTDAIPATDDQYSMVLMGSLTEANYTSLPCKLIGVVRIRYATATHDWTIQTLTPGLDGIGIYALESSFANPWIMPTGQMGATAGSYILPNAGTAPIFSTLSYFFTVDRGGRCFTMQRHAGDGGTDGVGAVATLISLPYFPSNTSYPAVVQSLPFGSAQAATTMTAVSPVFASLVSSNATLTLTYMDAATNIASVQNGFFTNGGRSIFGNLFYKAFDSTI